LYIVAVAVVIALAKVKGAGSHWPSSRPVAAAAGSSSSNMWQPQTGCSNYFYTLTEGI